MLDKRSYYAILDGLSTFYPECAGLIESIQQKFDEVEPITEKELRALKQYPIQFVYRITEDDGDWTTKLHIWAENGVPDILNLDPVFLGFKNSRGDSVLMCLAVAATGTHTGRPNYELIKNILDRDYTYEDVEKTTDGEDEILTRNAMDETDIHGNRPIDYITDIAFAKGDYSDDEPDLYLIDMLSNYQDKYSFVGDDAKSTIDPVATAFEPSDPAHETSTEPTERTH